MELLNFSQSLKLCIQLCESLNAHELSQKIAKFVSEKEQKDLMIESYKATTSKAAVSGLENRRLMKAAISSHSEKPDLS